MKRSATNKNDSKAGSTVLVYVAGVRGKVALAVPVASPTNMRRALKLSPTSRRRVERVMARAGLRRKAG